MATSPISGTQSAAAQLALQQIRALRQAAPAQRLVQAPAATPAAAPPKSQPSANLTLANRAAGNRPRGSIINIVA
jgi:hypothetical protein